MLGPHRSPFFVASILLVAVATVATPATPATAGDHPHAREGFVLGFGLGVGSAEGRLDDDRDVLFATERTGGGAASFRVGYAVNPSLVLGLETTGWGRTDEERVFGENVEISTTLNVTALALTWFPGVGGFFARAGLGVGIARQEYDLGGVSAEIDGNGLGLLLAAGYEWRLTKTFALGTQLDLGFMNLGDLEVQDENGDPTDAEVSFNYSSVSVVANWYFGG